MKWNVKVALALLKAIGIRWHNKAMVCSEWAPRIHLIVTKLKNSNEFQKRKYPQNLAVRIISSTIIMPHLPCQDNTPHYYGQILNLLLILRCGTAVVYRHLVLIGLCAGLATCFLAGWLAS